MRRPYALLRPGRVQFLRMLSRQTALGGKLGETLALALTVKGASLSLRGRAFFLDGFRIRRHGVGTGVSSGPDRC